MKKILILIVILAIVATGAYFVTRNTGRLNADADISIADTSIVAKLFLSDMQGHNIVVQKKEGTWVLNDSLFARKDAIESILETIHKIEATQPVPTAAHDNVVKELSVTGIKVEVYNAKNDVIRSFTIGGSNQDGVGNYIYKKNCDRPYIYTKPGFIGDLSVAFFTDADEWKSREIFHYNAKEIEKIVVNYAQNKDSSFTITQSNNEYTAMCNNGNTIDFSNIKIKDYLNEYASKYCSSFENRLKTKDSIITKGEPYGHIAIKKLNAVMDTLHLVYFKANQKASVTKEINGEFFDQEFLIAYNKKDMMILPTASFSKLLSHPAYFAK